MAQQTRLFYGPDLDQAWSRNGGVCSFMSQLFPTARGHYATVGNANSFGSSTLTTMPLVGYMFRQVSGTERLLMFNTTSIDEYDNAATRTSRGTGYSASTTGWSAAAFGNFVIAVNYYDAAQVSSGAGFGALGGSPPKARHVTVQSNFVMFADTDDGTNQYADQVWWSGLGNSASYTPDLASQAGNIRLVGAPGPIRCLVNFRDYVVAFKDDATFIGQYVGPPYIWSWRLASNRVGCSAQHGAVEYGGVLYFIHPSGIYSFDGSQFRNIGDPIMQTLLYNCGYSARDGAQQLVASTTNGGDIRLTQAVSDDIEGMVLFAPMCLSGGNNAKRTLAFAYNVISQRWGVAYMLSTASEGANGDQVAFVKCTSADMQTFLPNVAFSAPKRFIYARSVSSSVTMRHLLYPAPASPQGVRIKTGFIGTFDKSSRSNRLQFRMSQANIGGGTDTPLSMDIYPYDTEETSTEGSSATGRWNDDKQCVDFQNSSRFARIDTIWATDGTNNKFELAAVDVLADQQQRP